MDNNPSSYRAPEVHLSDIVPTKKKVVPPPEPQLPVHQLTEEDLDPHTETEKLQQEFIERTQEELQKMMEESPKKEEFEDIGIQFIEHDTSPRAPQNSEKAPFHALLDKKDAVHIRVQEDETEKQEKESAEPAQFAGARGVSSDLKRQEKHITIESVSNDESQAPPSKEGAQQATGNEHEIASLFETYLETEGKQNEIQVKVKKERPLIPPPLPDPLDIWEQDAVQKKVAVEFKKKDTPPQAHQVEKSSETDFTQPEPKGMGLGRMKTPTLSESKEHDQPEKEQGSNPAIDVLTLPKEEELHDFSHFMEKDKKPNEAVQNSNLTELRERIAKAHSEDTSTVQKNDSPETTVLDDERDRLNSRVQEKIQILTGEESDTQDEKSKPQSRHASVISDVAERLHSISMGEEIHSSHKPEPLQETITPEEAPGNEQGQELTPPQPKSISTQETPEEPEKQKPIPGKLRAHTSPPPKTSGLPLLRTFKQDVEQAVNKDKTSVVGILTAEQNRLSQNASQAPVAKIRTVKKPMANSLAYTFAAASILLIVSAIGVGGFLLYSYLTSDMAIQSGSITSTNKSASYTITDKSRDEVLQELTRISKTIQISLGSLVEIELLDRGIKAIEGSENVLTTKASARTVVSLIAPNAPESLIRALVDPLLLGVYEMPDGNKPFLILKVDHKDVGFRGMFDWEEKMNADLEPLFGPLFEKKIEEIKNEVVVIENASTSSSTEMVVPKKTIRYEKIQFEDSFIANKEVRGLKDDSGTFILLWTMPDEKTILIAKDEVTMRVILEKIATLEK